MATYPVACLGLGVKKPTAVFMKKLRRFGITSTFAGFEGSGSGVYLGQPSGERRKNCHSVPGSRRD